MTSSRERTEVRQSLLRYVAENPHASDTIDGIREFWLSEHLGLSTGNLEIVLRELVVEGALTATPLFDDTLYSVTNTRR